MLHHDETPARVAGDDGDRLLHIYTARCGPLVWFGAAAGRGHAQLDGFGILPGYRGTLVRDDCAGYAKYDKDLTAVQLCCAHLTRALRGVSDLDREGGKIQGWWADEVTAVLIGAEHAVDQARRSGQDALDPQVLAALHERCDKAVRWGILTNRDRDRPSGRHPGIVLARRLQTRKRQVWRFTVDFAVPFTNNPVEQPRRMVKLQMKIGGCWRSVRTAAHYCVVRSYLATARNHGLHPLGTLREALAGQPWTPPQAA